MIDDAELYALVHRVVDPIVQAARRSGPIPSLNSPEFASAPRLAQLAAVLVLGEAYLVGEAHITEWLTQGYLDGPWHRHNALTGPAELDLRRYPPTGDRATWIKYGPDGPPPEGRRAA